MRVAIDTLFETPGCGTGGLTYLTSLIRAIPRVPNSDTPVIMCSRANRTYFEAIPGTEVLQVGWSNEARLRRLFTQQVLLDRAARSAGCTVLLGAGNSVPLAGQLPSVVVLHSLHWLLDSAHVGAARSLYRRLMVGASCRKATRIIAVSQYLADVLCDWRPAYATKTRVVLEGVASDYQARDARDPFSEIHLSGERVVLFASTLWPYKNLDVVVRAVAALGREGGVRLVVCGGDFNGEMDRLRALASQVGLASEIEFLGHVPQERMSSMYSSADVVVYPSRCEWFGLPLVEAMACSVPVIAAKTSCIPEIAADGAVLFDADDHTALAFEIDRVLNDPPFRTSLVARGSARAASLTWENTAENTLAVLREAAGE